MHSRQTSHTIEGYEIALSAHDDKRTIMPDKIHTHAHGFGGGALLKEIVSRGVC